MLSRQIDAVLEYLKWPIAVLATCSVPFLLYGVVTELFSIWKHPWNAFTLSLGVAAFIFLWVRFLRKLSWTEWLLRLEHEVTHALFALATGHPLLGFRNSLKSGASVKFSGKGNWLIASAPYFFPTATIVFWVISLLMPLPFLPWTNLLLGFSLGFHVVSTYRETHRDQEDLKIISWKFCWLFLPAVNLLFMGALIAFALGGFSGILGFFENCIEPFGWLSSNADPIIPNEATSVEAIETAMQKSQSP